MQPAQTSRHVGCRKELEEGKSYDKLWNAAQLELVHTGKMHGFMRMCVAHEVACRSASMHPPMIGVCRLV